MSSLYDEAGVQDLVQALLEQRRAMRRLKDTRGLLEAAQPASDTFNEHARVIRSKLSLAWDEGPLNELLLQAFQQRQIVRKSYIAVADSYADFLAAYYGSFENAPKGLRLIRWRQTALTTLDNLDRIDRHYIAMISMELNLDELLMYHPSVAESERVIAAREARSRYFKKPSESRLERCVELYNPSRLFELSESETENSRLELDPDYRALCNDYDEFAVAAMLAVVTA